MRNNQPVTGVEYMLRKDQSLISRTNTKGIITYTNRDFTEVSGFTDDELIGAPHNIVRHPDMPVEAFEDFWLTLKSGYGWTGMVKNRRKNGDYYWVLANATPIWENGEVTGYTSVRTMPSREQIEEATRVYAHIKEGNAKGLKIRHGKVVKSGLTGMLASLRHLHIRGRINAVLAALCLVIIAIGALGLMGLNSSNRSLDSMYQDRIVPMGQLDTIVRLLNRSDIAVLEALDTNDPRVAGEARRQIDENGRTIDAQWKAYTATTLTTDEKRLADQFAADYARYLKNGLSPASAALAKNDMAEVKRLHDQVMNPTFVPVRTGINELLNVQLVVAKQASEAAAAQYASIRNTVVAATLLALGFAVFMGVVLSRAIVRPLSTAVDVAKQIAAGNLMAQVDSSSQDETGQILHALSVMKSSLTNIVAGVRRNAESIAAGAAQIAVGNADLSARTERQASSLEETAASMEELTSTVKNNAENSRGAKKLVEGARDTAAEGGAAMDQVVRTMESITASSQRITDIIGVIDGIAFQTNILALNAAVEAARAGEQGRGFAVVAAEVRTLAQRSAAAAKEIKDLINASVSQVEHGSTEVSHARRTMEDIMASVRHVADIMNDITASSQEQSSGIEQVSQAVVHMDQVTQENAALVEEAAAASESLQQQGMELMQAVGVFRVEGSHQAASVTRIGSRVGGNVVVRGGRRVA
ncbi:methyl-accepting chemotaxis protein [Noviherbaspirillum sp.]|jgi:PAS domain S-box-containing protein|uniref:methyl-accepting chemotaxis protein n=1 Tax=Noviherbaspirillum sp. TaxID=1926288 RepID=UPI0025DA4085|nr:methyl-accepting chemotaxis protein [Noviherbaspirillum sp.]